MQIMAGKLRRMALLISVVVAAAASGCASRTAVLEVSGSVMYEKPGIESVTHTVDDRRAAGGPARVAVTLVGDPGLAATFDITPGIVNRRPLTETSDGRYVGEFSFAADAVGGPYTIIGRLRHDQAGEAVVRDTEPIILSVPDRS